MPRNESVTSATEKVFIVFATLIYDNDSLAFNDSDYYYYYEDESKFNVTNLVANNGTSKYGAPIQWGATKVLIVIGSTIVICDTIFGNMLVMLAVVTEKRLRTPFNYYVFNLAFSDMNIGFVMLMYTVNNLYEYFPFNNYWCGYWVWADYTMTFESVFSLCVISIDRFWSVTWTIHYRNNNSGKKSFLIIITTWIIVNTIWLPSFIYDRLYNSYDPGVCQFDPAKNIKKVVYIAVLGYYTPLVIMLVAYLRIFYVMRNRLKVSTTKKENNLAVVYIAVLGYYTPLVIMLVAYLRIFYVMRNRLKVSTTKKENNLAVVYIAVLGYYTPLVIMLVAYLRIFYVMRNRLKVSTTKKENNLAVPPTSRIAPTSGDHASTERNGSAKNDANSRGQQKDIAAVRAHRERKAFMTLAHIVVAFLICWVPFYILFLVDPLAPDFFPDWYTELSYWMAYLNSSLNPIIYSLSSDEFRSAFKRILRCKR